MISGKVQDRKVQDPPYKSTVGHPVRVLICDEVEGIWREEL
jgi:hypothetical protein